MQSTCFSRSSGKNDALGIYKFHCIVNLDFCLQKSIGGITINSFEFPFLQYSFLDGLFWEFYYGFENLSF